MLFILENLKQKLHTIDTRPNILFTNQPVIVGLKAKEKKKKQQQIKVQDSKRFSDQSERISPSLKFTTVTKCPILSDGKNLLLFFRLSEQRRISNRTKKNEFYTRLTKATHTKKNLEAYNYPPMIYV